MLLYGRNGQGEAGKRGLKRPCRLRAENMTPFLRMGAHVVAVLIVWLLLSAGAQEKDTPELLCGQVTELTDMINLSFKITPNWSIFAS